MQNELEYKNQVDIFDYLNLASGSLSSEEILDAIKKLAEAHETAVKKENREKKKELKQKKLEEKNTEEEKLNKVIQNSTTMELPLDYENIFNNDDRIKDIHTDSISDGLILSLSNVGKVDIEYISSITGASHKKIIETLKGSIYQNPEKWEECFYKGWETADEYLTGNLMQKYRIAKLANEKYKKVFHDNINALLKVIPTKLAADDIFITLGSPWVPTSVIDDFIEYMLGSSYCSNKDYAKVKHDELTGTWDIPEKNRYSYNHRSDTTFGTNRMEALYILEKTLNMKNIVVTDSVPCVINKSGKKQVINKAETTLALEKQKYMIETFQEWVWKNKQRAEMLKQIFEDKYSCFRRRRYDGSFLTFPNLDKKVQLYSYQKDAVARILFNQNTLLAHDVGSGKTYIMIAAGMELKRMGLSKKNLYVVPNNIVGQWKKIFLSMYPNANLLVVEPRNFVPSKRENILNNIKTKDYDGIIMAYSCFEMIPLSKDFYIEKLKKRKEILDEFGVNNKKNTSGIKQEKKRIVEQLENLMRDVNLSSLVTTFDELHITRLFVDEAHNFKNVPIKTKIERVLGLSTTGSKKCQEMLDKVHFVQRNGGVIFATGTPITNSITGAYVMQLYLQSGELSLLDLQSFDAWVGMFAERKSEFEIDVDTSGYRLATRFSKFHNLTELTSILSSIADFHSTKKSDDLPEFKGYKDCLVAKTQDFSDYLKLISKRADAVRNNAVCRTDDNMLMITNDGRKAALDIRLVDNTKPFTYQSKVYRCAENVFDIYRNGESEKLTQLIFCDTSTPKDDFNIYDEMCRLLVSFGINKNEIAYIHDATTESKRDELFLKMRKGIIRVLIGSTFKLGLGVNVQDKLIAIHHLDIPWRPADMVQREGRIIRPGNTNKEVFIYRYITEGSFDAYSWQLLETKQNFISTLLAGSLEENDSLDIQDTVLNYAEVKALAIGNPLIKHRVEVANTLTKLKQLQSKTIEMKENLSQEYSLLPKEISDQQERISKCDEDIIFYETEKAKRLEKKELENKDRDEKLVKAESIEKKKKFNEMVYTEVLHYSLEKQEKYLTDYCGFKVILPANMLNNKLYVYLENCGRYYVELGETNKGVTTRFYNCLEGLKDRRKRLNDRLQEMQIRYDSIKQELAKDADYSEKIEEVKQILQEIDKQLGVKNE